MQVSLNSVWQKSESQKEVELEEQGWLREQDPEGIWDIMQIVVNTTLGA